MKIFSFARKELGLIASQKSSLILVILYPLFIVLVLAVAFGSQEIQPQTGFEQADVAYYIPKDAENFDSEGFIDKLSRVERLSLHRARSEEAVKEANESLLGTEQFRGEAKKNPVHMMAEAHVVTAGDEVSPNGAAYQPSPSYQRSASHTRLVVCAHRTTIRPDPTGSAPPQT